MEPWTAFILGLAGSLHCAGMCGPLALAMPRTGSTAVTFALGRLSYNAGRVLTYILLGIVAGSIGGTLVLAGVTRWLSIGAGGLMVVAALVSTRGGFDSWILKLPFGFADRWGGFCDNGGLHRDFSLERATVCFPADWFMRLVRRRRRRASRWQARLTC